MSDPKFVYLYHSNYSSHNWEDAFDEPQIDTVKYARADLAERLAKALDDLLAMSDDKCARTEARAALDEYRGITRHKDAVEGI